MKFKTLKIFFFSTLLCSTIFSHAQDNINLNVCGVNKVITFSKDSIRPFNASALVKFNYLPSIKKSDAEVEIRIHFVTGNYESLKTYKFYEDSVKFLLYDLILVSNDKKSERLMSSKYSFIGIQGTQRIYIKKKSEHLILGKKSCNLLKSILENQIGIIPNGPELDTLVRKKFPTITKFYESVGYLEVKIGSYFRNIKLSQIDYSNEAKFVEYQIPFLQNKKEINNLLNKIENETKI